MMNDTEFCRPKKQVKLKWLQNPSHINADNLSKMKLVDIRGTRRWNISKV